MPTDWRAIHSELSRPVIRKKCSTPRALSSSATAVAAFVVTGVGSGVAGVVAGMVAAGREARKTVVMTVP